MRSMRLRSTDLSRRGLIAVGEMLVMLAVLVTLFWLGSQFLATFTSGPTSALPLSTACSERAVFRISPTADGKRLWVYRPCSGVARLDLTTGEMEQPLPSAEMELTALAHSCDGSTTLLCGADGTVSLNCDGEESRFFSVHMKDNDMIRNASVSDEGTVSACVTSLGRVFVWSRPGADLREFTYDLDSDASISQIKLNRTGRRLLVFRCDGTVSFHNPETGELIGGSLHFGPDCTAVAWSDNERLVGALFSTNKVRVYEAAECTIACEQRLDTHHCLYGKIEFSPDGHWIAIITDVSKEIHIWNLETGQIAGPLRGHEGIVRAIRFSPTSDRLYSGSFDGTIREWSLDGCSQPRVIN